MSELFEFIHLTGFPHLEWRMLVMWAVVLVLFYLAVFKKFEPLLLVPIAFGALLANLPTQGIINKPASDIRSPADGQLIAVFTEVGDTTELPKVKRERPSHLMQLYEQGGERAIKRYFEDLQTTGAANELLFIVRPAVIDERVADILIQVDVQGYALHLSPDDYLGWTDASGRVVRLDHRTGESIIHGQRVLELHSTHAGGLFHYIRFGIILELFPPLIFLGVGALTDFGALIANPRMLLLGAAAQFGVFATFLGAVILGFSVQAAGAIAIIGGADGPTSIFLANSLAPDLLAPIAVAAYSYMALVPVIQPPIMRALTTEAERKIRMKSLRKVSRTEKLVFAVMVTVFCILLVPAASPLIGMLFLGNFLRECGVTERLSKSAQNEIINIITIFLGTSVGITMTGDRFIRTETLMILGLGVLAFAVSTAAGVLMAKLMNLIWRRNKINPLIGSAGVSAVPMAARVSQVVGQESDPNNFLLMHAMGPNVAGVIGTALVAGFFLTILL